MKKKIAIITGGGGGIGSALVNEFIRNEYMVYSLEKKVFDNSRILNLKRIKVDITNYTKIKEILKNINLKFGKIDLIINCAGITRKINKKNLINYWNFTINNNLTAAFMISMLAYPYLKKSDNPSIINITSITSQLGMSSNPAYNASKAGLKNLSYSLAMDFKKDKIRVNNISPGYIKTNMTQKSFKNKKLFKERIQRMIINEYGAPEDIAKAALFLASKDSKYINAADIVVDGGFLRKGV